MYTIDKCTYIHHDEKIYISKSTYYPWFGDHNHGFLEVVYIQAGSALHCINGKSYRVTRGDIFLLDYSDIHNFLETSSDFTIITCAFLPELIDQSLIHSENADDMLRILLSGCISGEHAEFRFSVNLMGRQKALEGILEEMWEEFKNKEPGYQNILKGYLTILLTRILRAAAEKHSAPAVKRQNEIMQRVVEYLTENYSKPLKLEEIARQVLFSPSHFASVFKNTTGNSFTNFLHKLRMEEACGMLAKTDKNISEVIYEVGYSDSKFFYKIFKRYTGMTPGEYKKRM